MFYWPRNAKSSKAEVDYSTAKEGKVMPLEVEKRFFREVKKSPFIIKSFAIDYVRTYIILRFI